MTTYTDLIARLRSMDTYGYESQLACASADALEAQDKEIKELRRDAERYRWLRDDNNWGDDAEHRWEVLGEKSCKDFDAAIDAAMKESE